MFTINHKPVRYSHLIAVMSCAGVLLAGAGVARAQPAALSAPAAEAPPIRMPVLVLAYYPPDAANPALLDATETDVPNQPIAAMQAKVQQLIDNGLALASEATRYHGYKDPNAPVYLSYFMLQKLEYFQAMPRGVVLKGETRRPNYGQIMRDHKICDYVDKNGVKEVWIYGYHSTLIEPDESKMSSRYGDISNANPPDDIIPKPFRLPRCANSYVMYNFNYAREVDTNLHNRMHQIEHVISFMERGRVAGSVFWGDFSEPYPNPGDSHSYRSSCGNGHWAPNWTDSANHGYQYSLPDMRENNCETWHPDDSQTTYVNANCSQWGCTELGYYKWFMQNMPGYNNGIVYKGKRMRNWWDAMRDFNAFVAAGRGLYGR